MITVFFITTLILFIGVCVIRSYTFSSDIVHQQYRYWKRYYRYEGCLEYALAYFYQNSDKDFAVIPYCQKNYTYSISLTVNRHGPSTILLITIEQEKNISATAQITLEKNELSWVIKDRKVMIQSPIDLDKKALLSYTKLLKN